MDKFLDFFKKGKPSKKEDEKLKESKATSNKSENILQEDDKQKISEISGTKISNNDKINMSLLPDKISAPINESSAVEKIKPKVADLDDIKAADVVIVNSNVINNKAEGFYYKKYINEIQKLNLSNPIQVEREKMRVNFDHEVMDYLVNDLTMIFREKQSIIDNNQADIIKEMNETKDLISIMSDIHKDSNFNYSLEFVKKQKKLINDIDYMEVVVNTLNMEADNMMKLIEEIESKIAS